MKIRPLSSLRKRIILCRKKYKGASQLFYASDYKYFDKARQAALISDFPRPHIGCVAVYHGQVIAAGFNRQ